GQSAHWLGSGYANAIAFVVLVVVLVVRPRGLLGRLA
ncbi:MAG: branched-chain amino acid ABC transporter permease, partial [Chloroflexi bacterium]